MKTLRLLVFGVLLAKRHPLAPAPGIEHDFFTREQRWRTAFESSAIGITMADLDGHYLAANTVFQNMVGYTEAELREFSFFDITYEEDREPSSSWLENLWSETRYIARREAGPSAIITSSFISTR